MSFLQRSTTRMYTFNYSYEPSNTKQSKVVEIQSTDQLKTYFDASKRNNKLLVMEFTAAWCNPCRFIEPTIKDFSATYSNVDFIKIDVDKLVFVADQFEANTLPAFVLIKQGKEVDRVLGAKKIDLQNKIEQYVI